jgi:hypothetical protein
MPVEGGSQPGFVFVSSDDSPPLIHRPFITPIGAETVIVVFPDSVDEFGDPVGSGAPGGRIEGCAVVPRSASEDSFRAATTTTDMLMIAPVYETDLDATHSVVWRGNTYEIQGTPVPWIHLSGEYAGTQVNLKRSGG